MFSTLRLLTLRLKTVKWRFYGWTEKKTQQTEFGFCRLYSFAGWKCFFRLSEKKRKKHSWQIERRKNTFRLCLSEVLKAKKMTFFHLFFWQLLRYDSYKKRNLDFSTCRLENNWKTVIKQTFIDTEFKKLFVNLRRFCAVWQLVGILIFISTFLAVWLLFLRFTTTYYNTTSYEKRQTFAQTDKISALSWRKDKLNLTSWSH